MVRMEVKRREVLGVLIVEVVVTVELWRMVVVSSGGLGFSAGGSLGLAPGLSPGTPPGAPLGLSPGA